MELSLHAESALVKLITSKASNYTRNKYKMCHHQAVNNTLPTKFKFQSF